MKSVRVIIGIFLSICYFTTSAQVNSEDVLTIINKIDSVNRQSFSTSILKMKLSTCRYILKNGRMDCSETPRMSVLENVVKHYGNKNSETKTVAVVLEPIKDKGIGMLNFEYVDINKENEAWLYLSAIGKVKRLVANSDDTDGNGSFFGSEFSVEDMTIRKTNDYTYNLINEETYDERPVWVIESIPTKSRSKKSKYGKIVSWVDQERYLILKEDLYDHKGKLCKQQTRRDIQQIDNVWVVKTTTMNNLSSQRVSVMKILSVAYNMDVPDEFLTQRALIDFAFREKILDKLRQNLK